MRGTALALLVLTSACATPTLPPSALSVATFREQAPNLVGQTVTLVGFVGPCHPRSCAIADQPEVWGKGSNWLSIGRSPDFDQKIKAFKGRRIMIRATFTGSCFDFDPDDDLIAVCADRVATLSNPELVGPATNSKD